MIQNEYRVYFDYSTFRGNCITGRKGYLNITTELSLEELRCEKETLKQLCINFVYEKKPKWDIFMLEITSIEAVKQKAKKKLQHDTE